jgi:hypothetical protein
MMKKDRQAQHKTKAGGSKTSQSKAFKMNFYGIHELESSHQLKISKTMLKVSFIHDKSLKDQNFLIHLL